MKKKNKKTTYFFYGFIIFIVLAVLVLKLQGSMSVIGSSSNATTCYKCLTEAGIVTEFISTSGVCPAGYSTTSISDKECVGDLSVDCWGCDLENNLKMITFKANNCPEGSSTNFSLSPCAKNYTTCYYCVNGKEATVELDSCGIHYWNSSNPSRCKSCSVNEDCGDCSECRSGVCRKMATCGQTCVLNSDCGTCQECSEGVCKNTAMCFNECSSPNDCSSLGCSECRQGNGRCFTNYNCANAVKPLWVVSERAGVKFCSLIITDVDSSGFESKTLCDDSLKAKTSFLNKIFGGRI